MTLEERSDLILAFAKVLSIGLRGFSQAAIFWSGFFVMDMLPRLPDHDRAQRMGRHALRSGLSWTRFCGAGFGCEVMRILRLRCAIRQDFERAYQALGINDRAMGRSLKKLSNPGWREDLG